METPRVNRPNPIAVRQVSYKNLVDAPSPCGRLGDRIVRLKQRCILALGRRAFDEAYAFLKQHAADDVSIIYGLHVLYKNYLLVLRL